MRSVVPYIVYPWLAVSLVIYGRRLYRRWYGGTPDPTSPPATIPGSPAPSPPATGSPARPAPDRTPSLLRKSTPPAAPTGPAVPHVRATPEALPVVPPQLDPAGRPVLHATHYPLEPSVAAALEAEGRIPPSDDEALPPTPAPEPVRTGLFAKAERAATGAARLDDLMAGVQLPRDLAPLVSTDDLHRADVHVAFRTAGHNAADVARDLGDELERLGFLLASVSDTQVLATRDDGRLLVTVHASPRSVERDGRPAFPTTLDGDVVVEVDVA